MSEKFDPSNDKYKKVEDLPEEEQSKFKNVEGGFVETTAIENEEKAESMAHAENNSRSESEATISRIREGSIESADEKGESAGKKYDEEQGLLRLEKLGEDEGVLNAAKRLKASFEEQGLERGDQVEVYLKDGSREQGYHDDVGGGAEKAIDWSEDNKKAFYALGTRINQGEFSFGIRWHMSFPVQAIERVVLVRKRASSQFA